MNRGFCSLYRGAFSLQCSLFFIHFWLHKTAKTVSTPPSAAATAGRRSAHCLDASQPHFRGQR